MDTLISFIDFISTSLTIIIVAVPEGLPSAVSMSIGFSMENMKKEDLLVTNSEAIETIATVNEICIGKTATLTNNYMTVVAIYFLDYYIENKEFKTFS